jgi:putative colanic acid biosysnthesis UDP-glucose lipid carrier transferase
LSELTTRIKPKSETNNSLLQLFDCAVIIGSLLILAELYYSPEIHYGIASLGVALLFLVLGNNAGIYSTSSPRGYAGEIARLFQVWALVVLISVFVAYVTKTSELFSRAAVLSWIFAVPTTMSLARLAYTLINRRLQSHTDNNEHTVIVGLNPAGLLLARTIIARPELGINVKGFYDASKTADSPMPTDLHLPLLGDLSKLAIDARTRTYDSVYIASIHDEAQLRSLINDLADSRVKLRYIPDIFTLNLLDSRISDISGIPYISVYDSPLDGQGSTVKRLEDIVLGTLILGVICIPMLLIACTVKITSSGPIIFRQKRYGLRGEEFRVWKFRTMTVCEDGEAAVQASRDDPRVTPIGRFLRKTSLDELPQFLNVLAGAMSIVGPRPHPVALNEQFRGEIEGYMLRHVVKPGITGWAQVNGWRGETESREKMAKRVQHDLHYIRNWSLWFDLRIIAITILKGFGGKNAY